MNKILSIVIITVLTLLSSYIKADELTPFTSDGCSLFPNGTITQNTLWLSCCTAHDVDYWQGGTYQERIDADQALKQCVAKVGHPEIAKLMLTGVRVGGTPYLPTSFRWGYGWPYPRFYVSLTKKEREQVNQLKPRNIQVSSNKDQPIEK